MIVGVDKCSFGVRLGIKSELKNIYRKYKRMKHGSKHKESVTTALLLAAGTGSRLYPLTQNAPKCLTLVNGISILERLLSGLNQHGFKRLVVITGHLQNCIKDYLGTQFEGIAIEYVFSPRYNETNNIYSLWMAREIIKESFMLVESDVVFENSLLESMLIPDRIAVAKMQPWMDGGCVTIDRASCVKEFFSKRTDTLGESKHKTVNIYSISQQSWHGIKVKLEQRICEGRVNDYYETVFAEMTAEGSLNFETVSFDSESWYEIDTIEDLVEAEKLFSIDAAVETGSLALAL